MVITASIGVFVNIMWVHSLHFVYKFTAF
jgi:hypothetical protein